MARTKSQQINDFVVVDVGGYSTQMGLVDSELKIVNTQAVQVDSVEALAANISDICSNPKKVAIAVPGPVDYSKNMVKSSIFCPWVVGELPKKLRSMLGENVEIQLLNDGDAHTLAMIERKDIVLGAISISLGTSFGFGVLDKNGKLVRTLSGDNWELGHFIISESPLTGFEYSSKVGYLFGNNGLTALKQKYGDSAYKLYGELLGGFLLKLTVIFQPNTIFLTGGITKHYGKKFIPFVDDILSNRCKFVNKPIIITSNDFDSALTGLVKFVEKESLEST